MWMVLFAAALASPPELHGSHGWLLAGGDADGDGYDDLLFRRNDEALLLYRGGTTGIDLSQPSWSFPIEPFEYPPVSIRDIDGDGYDELLVVYEETELAYLFRGSSAGWSPTADWTMPVPGDALAAHLTGDLDGDGLGDAVIVSAEGSDGIIRVVPGAPGGLAPAPSHSLSHPEANNYSVSSGDVNGDGYADVMVNRRERDGGAWVLYGSASGPPVDLASVPVVAHETSFEYGLPRIVADLDGDGLDDVVLGDDDAIAVLPGATAGLDLLGAASASAHLLALPRETSEYNSFLYSFAFDVDDDGSPELLLSIPDTDSGEYGEGMLAVYGGAGGLTEQPWWTAQSNVAGGYMLAHTVADTDGDGLGEVWVDGSLQERSYEASASGLGGGMPDATWMSTDPLDFAGLGVGGADLDGDGFGDLVVGEADEHHDDEDTLTRFHVFRGTAGGIESTPQLTIDGSNAGARIESLGDLDGDGDEEVILGQMREMEVARTGPCSSDGDDYYSYYYSSDKGYECPYPTSWWSVLFGSPTLDDDQQIRSEPDFFFGMGLVNAGDVNGDGHDDVLAYGSREQVSLFTGLGDGTFSVAPLWSLPVEPAFPSIGGNLAGIGDVNGDGFADVAVGDPGWSLYGPTEPGRVSVFLGGVAGPQLHLELVGSKPKAAMGVTVAGADLNGDGYSDLMVGSMLDGGHVYYGSATGLDGTPDWQVPSDDAVPHGYHLQLAGDVDGDRIPDLLARPVNDVGVGVPPLTLGLARYDGPEPVRLFLGAPGGLASTPVWSMQPGWGTGTTARGVGDLDGDGQDDLALTGSQRLIVVYGADITSASTAPWTIPTIGTDPGTATDTGAPQTSTSTDTKPADEDAKACGCASADAPRLDRWWQPFIRRR